MKYARKAVRARMEEKAYPLQGTPGDSDYLHVITGIVPPGSYMSWLSGMVPPSHVDGSADAAIAV